MYQAKVELADDVNPRVHLLLRIAEAFQVMGNALVRDVLSRGSRSSTPVAQITHEQAEVWYGRIPDLLIEARKESLYPGSSHLSFPVDIGRRVEFEHTCPLSHLVGLRSVAHDLEDMVAKDVDRIRLHKDEYRETLMFYEVARTRRNAGDALIGPIMGGQRVPHETHEDAMTCAKSV